jgi:hypothetical protein
MWAVPLLRRLIADFSMRRPGFDPGHIALDWGTGAGFFWSTSVFLASYHSIYCSILFIVIIVIYLPGTVQQGDVIGGHNLTPPHEYKNLKECRV